MDAPEAAGTAPCLPGFDMKFVQQRAVTAKAEQIFIALKAAPPFNAFSGTLQAENARALPLRVVARAGGTDRRGGIALVAERGSSPP